MKAAPVRAARRAGVPRARGFVLGDPALALGVFLVAFALRAWFVLGSGERAWPHSILYEGDATAWIEWARALRDGRAFEFGLPNRPPGAAWLLHALHPSVEPPFTRAKLVWGALSAASTAVAYLAFRVNFVRRTSLVAAGFLALAFVGLESASSLNNDAPYGLAVALVVWGTLASERSTGGALWLAPALGLAHGAAALLRAEHLALFALFAGVTTWRAARAEGVGRAARALALQCVALAAVLAPWIASGQRAVERYNERAPAIAWERLPLEWSADARAAVERLPAFARLENVVYASDRWVAQGASRVDAATFERFLLDTFGSIPRPLARWVPVSGKGALDFALANHPASDGGFTRAPLDRAGLPQPPFAFALPHHLELYNHGYAHGLRWIAEDPLAWLALCGRKLARHAHGFTQGLGARNAPLFGELERAPVDLAVATGARWIAWALLLGALAIVGIARIARTSGAWPWLALLAFDLAITLAFYGYARTAVPFLPAFALGASLGADALSARTTARFPAARRLAPWILAALALPALLPPATRVAAPLDPARGLVPRPDLGPGAVTGVGPLRIRGR